MKKSKEKRRKGNKKQQRSKPKPPSNTESRFGRLWRGFLIFAALIGFAGTALNLLPKISVSANVVLDQSSPLTSTPFIVSNDGIVPLIAVQYSCNIKNANFSRGVKMTDNQFKRASHNKDVIWPGAKDNLPCARGEFTPQTLIGMTNAEIEIRVSYWPIIPMRRESVFRFQAQQSKTGEWQWLPIAR